MSILLPLPYAATLEAPHPVWAGRQTRVELPLHRCRHDLHGRARSCTIFEQGRTRPYLPVLSPARAVSSLEFGPDGFVLSATDHFPSGRDKFVTYRHSRQTGELSVIAETDGTGCRYLYDGTRLLAIIETPGGLAALAGPSRHEFGYDPLGRLVRERSLSLDGTPYQSTRYHRDRVGRIRAERSSDSSTIVLHRYSGGRLIQTLSRSSPSKPLQVLADYLYDGQGRLTEEIRRGPRGDGLSCVTRIEYFYEGPRLLRSSAYLQHGYHEGLALCSQRRYNLAGDWVEQVWYPTDPYPRWRSAPVRRATRTIDYYPADLKDPL